MAASAEYATVAQQHFDFSFQYFSDQRAKQFNRQKMAQCGQLNTKIPIIAAVMRINAN